MARLRHTMGYWFAGRRIIFRRAAFGVHHRAKGCHRHRQHLDGGRQNRRRVVPPHQYRPPRFVLGIGAGHPEHTEQYRKPYDALVDYLDELDEYGVPANQRVLAALGPRVLGLAAERTAGAHPYNTTPEHTAQAREIIGPNALLLPEHKVLPIADAEEALAVGRKVLNTYNYLHLTNYVNNFKRLGFTDADLTPPGSDKFVEAMVAYGTPEDIANRLGEHLRAGANHVVIQVLGGSDKLLPTLSELAGALGLTPRP
jgi:probable F420-dependent oxidoreductase